MVGGSDVGRKLEWLISDDHQRTASWNYNRPWQTGRHVEVILSRDLDGRFCVSTYWTVSRQDEWHLKERHFRTLKQAANFAAKQCELPPEAFNETDDR